MPHLTLILGGARSGKSSYAQNLALETGGASVLYVATAEALDSEMRTRIAAHQADRPVGWRTLETPRQVGSRITAVSGNAKVVLVDCMTLLVSNVAVVHGETPDACRAEQEAVAEVDALLDAWRQSKSSLWIVVSNEVGLGLVPPTPLGRVYRDVLGRVNQRLAAVADEVLFLVAGLPMKVK
ncbi:MAG: bifunctional adenosylcobinamide kinase/adenosylcobinamide-phosphate guanylyltransferase [Lentisphaerae bacterium RIFOXYB12_FULL_65_16]|nr:MAG: bifunctional adenosylcobinamide kinase/adenosylcobinamide-phosphate guanylyltransferase [Lentisphaerae bacterium RIFOXYA12_64_32]OGV86902.1 MAG: bifunctional adenosylcobinamide kinase/adenosylcobinamide-phosphate guanylyltransferase [Lentisphaerae bacterium RIFOXYB12_FULL_65_16]